jgi:glycosyltransferase involved in cell wall biosynthesis
VKIGLIAPSPVPFQMGGAEKLFWGLLRYINAETPHACDLIKLPAPEQDFWSLVDAYERFSRLDVSHFDAVISGKYPAWSVRHNHHVVYMLHRLRGLYDAYHLFRLPLQPVTENRGAVEFLEWAARIEREPERPAGVVAECFDRLHAIRADEPESSLSRFPGPFARRVIRFLDDAALTPQSIGRFAAISRTVRDRDAYFPPHVDVSVLHPPSDIHAIGAGSDDYFFTVSRLDSAKRVGLLVDAMRHVSADVPLLIAGTGPEESYLRNRAAGDSRVRFLGPLPDKEIASYYRDALAVPYVPFDEDYGLVTVEAMMSSKPVVTTLDAGGPNELVRNAQTGYSVPPDAEAIGRALDALCNDRGMARTMGREGRKAAEPINWRAVVEGLIPVSPARTRPARARVPKITVATTFPIHPPRGGGQSRVYHLYRHLAAFWRVEVVSLADHGAPPFDAEIAPGMREIRVRKSIEHERAEQQLSADCGWLPVTDVATPRLHSLTPDFGRALRESARTSDVIVACHPYVIDPIHETAGSRAIWYEAQDIEVDLKQQAFPATKGAVDLLDDVARVEARCWRESTLVFACSQEDLDRLAVRYGRTRARLHVVPNGVAIDEVAFVGTGDRAALKQRLGLDRRPIALFMGSWHPPNLRAVERIFEMALRRLDVLFLVVGSVGMAYSKRQLPANVGIVGTVDDATRNVLLSVADVALNPMETGSGSNLKMLDYFASGVPVVSTAFGARGIDCRANSHLTISEIDRFDDAVGEVVRSDAVQIETMVRQARALVESQYDWASIAARFRAEIGEAPSSTPRDTLVTTV